MEELKEKVKRVRELMEKLVTAEQYALQRWMLNTLDFAGVIGWKRWKECVGEIASEVIEVISLVAEAGPHASLKALEELELERLRGETSAARVGA